MIKAGFGQRIVTPEIGAEMPGSINKHFAQNVHDDLLVNAMVIDDGDTQLVLAGLDALSIKPLNNTECTGTNCRCDRYSR